MDTPKTLELSNDEALVLESMLDRWFNPYGSDTRPTDRSFVHPSEEYVLSAVLSAQLESQVAETFAPDYAELLAAARERVAKLYGFED
jgi:hypothetical protein